MTRPKSLAPKIPMKIRLSADMHARIELEAFSPLSERPSYGVRNQIIDEALREYFEKRDRTQMPA